MARIKSTPEELAAQRKARQEERVREFKRFPGGMLYSHNPNHDADTYIDLDAGDPDRLKVYIDREETIFNLCDVAELAQFIRALVARYNARVQFINNTTQATPPLDTLENMPKGCM